jgi:hypothetical protein
MGSGNDAKPKQSSDAASPHHFHRLDISTASMKWLAMLEPDDLSIALCIILIFVAFISGYLLGALFAPRRHKERERPHARLAAAEGRPRRDGRERSTLPAVVTALIVVSGAIVLDHFKGPLFPSVLYCLSDGGAQITGECTGRRGSPFDRATDTLRGAPHAE